MSKKSIKKGERKTAEVMFVAIYNPHVKKLCRLSTSKLTSALVDI